MTGSTITKRRLGGLVALATAFVLLVGACGGEFRAERQGKQFGEAVCDVKKSGSKDEAERQLNQAQRQLRDLTRIVGRPINEDVSDIHENLSDLVEHTVNGNDALRQQDIAVIQRNLNAVAKGLTGKARAAYDGIQEGLADCDY